ncbi:hypothetical protein FIBSPDRAFT_1021421 [Athelia psychrophila]|uniref:Uncharacterized protein n=1 Tax=Athelia psychrophila TaxID=1759441 RepID=A0A166JQU1_9AGAM|nr:hypothetical protein FIBSPDRAFT_1021421 [Fibularhizoctonia sp. CBS 109695]
MPHHSNTIQRIRFVGGEWLDWKPEAASGKRSWAFYQAIDLEGIHTGANIAIMRCHPLHQDSLDSSLTSSIRSKATLLEGRVLGIKRVREGLITYVITDDIAGGLTTLRIPASATTVNPDGGLHTGAKMLRKHRGPALRFPTWIDAHDLQAPMARRRQRAVSRTLAPEI